VRARRWGWGQGGRGAKRRGRLGGGIRGGLGPVTQPAAARRPGPRSRRTPRAAPARFHGLDKEAWRVPCAAQAAQRAPSVRCLPCTAAPSGLYSPPTHTHLSREGAVADAVEAVDGGGVEGHGQHAQRAARGDGAIGAVLPAQVTPVRAGRAHLAAVAGRRGLGWQKGGGGEGTWANGRGRRKLRAQQARGGGSRGRPLGGGCGG
jgi:hypothetical protein